MKVLVVEDSQRMAELIRRGFQEEGDLAEQAPSGERALDLVETRQYDAIILDVGLPGIDGFETCKRIRELNVWTPILMLTARDSVRDRVEGLDVGADDYLVKPFTFDELFARLRALQRRGAEPRPSILTVGSLSLDPAAHTVTRDSVRVDLTSKEFALLELLMRHQGNVLTRSQILERLWDVSFSGESNVVDVFVRSLRQKIDKPFGTRTIETVRGTGYRVSEIGVDS